MKGQVLRGERVRMYEVASVCSVLGRCIRARARDGVMQWRLDMNGGTARCVCTALHVIFTLLIVLCKTYSYAQLTKLT